MITRTILLLLRSFLSITPESDEPRLKFSPAIDILALLCLRKFSGTAKKSPGLNDPDLKSAGLSETDLRAPVELFLLERLLPPAEAELLVDLLSGLYRSIDLVLEICLDTLMHFFLSVKSSVEVGAMGSLILSSTYAASMDWIDEYSWG